MKKFLKVALLGLICLTVMGANECGGQTPKKRFQQLKNEYAAKKNKGYDVSAVDALVPEIRSAFEAQDSARAMRHMDEAERLLQQAGIGGQERQEDVAYQKSTSTTAVSSNPDDSIFGLGYVVLEPGYAELYAKTGIKWIKLPDLSWKRLEPKPPVGGRHNYQWPLLDKIVKAYQAAGFRFIVLLRAKSTWASRSLRDASMDAKGTGGGIVTTPPKPEYWDDYADWVSAVVERYDGDGIADMPGLRFPILDYEIESEAQHSGTWQASIDDYLKLLATAYDAAKKANPKTRIIMTGINLGDTFDDFPDRGTADSRFSIFEKRGRKDVAFIKKVLSNGKYDIVEFHYNRDYTGIYGTVDFIRRYTDKEIWAGDATSGHWLVATGELNALFSDSAGTRLFDKIVAGDRKTVDWYRAEQSALTTKKFILSAEVGVTKVIMETTNQWPIPKGATYFWKSWHVQNMVTKDKSPLPVFHTLKLLVDKLDGFSSVKRLKTGDKVYGYEFMVKNKSVYAFWYDDRIVQGPGDPIAKTTVDLSSFVGKSSARVTHIITEPGRSTPRSETADLKKIVLTEIPIFVNP